MTSRATLASLLLIGFAGCATTKAPPASLTADSAAADFAARSLEDARLRQFLAENLGASADAPRDFETLSWVAFYYHPSLALARAQWATARAAQTSAAARPNPTLTLTPGYNTTREPGISPWFPSINADFLFPNSARRARQQDFARAEAEAARLSVLVAVWQVRAELRRALAEVASADQRVKVAEAQGEVQRALATLMDRRAAAGGATATELSAARVSAMRAEAAAGDARMQAAASRVRVASALGLPAAALGPRALPVPPAAPVLSPEALGVARHEALLARADILAALAKYHAAHAALEIEGAKQVPDFHLGPGYQWDQGANKWSLALSFELPVFHRNEGPIAEAVARRAEAAAQFSLVQAQALGAIDAAAAMQRAAAQQLDRARQLRGELQQQQARVQQRVELGAADQVELQLARIEAAATETAILDAETAAATAAGLLEDALQLPFPHLAALAENPHGHISSSP